MKKDIMMSEKTSKQNPFNFRDRNALNLLTRRIFTHMAKAAIFCTTAHSEISDISSIEKTYQLFPPFGKKSEIRRNAYSACSGVLLMKPKQQT